jgi:hypothetical protein
MDLLRRIEHKLHERFFAREIDPYIDDFEYIAVIGFEKEPDPTELYPKLEELGAVVLEERQSV